MSDSSSVPEAGGELRTVLDRMTDGFFAVDTDWLITYVNGRGEEILRSAMEEQGANAAESIVGQHLWESIPDAVDTEFYHRYHEAMETGEPCYFDANYRPLSTWFDVRVFPSESGISVYLRDVSTRRTLERQREESRRAIQRLYALSADPEQTFEEKLDAVLELGCAYLGLETGYLTRIEDGTQHIVAVAGADTTVQPGDEWPLSVAYCRRTLEADDSLVVIDATADDWEADAANERFGLQTYVGGRVEVDGAVYGTLCFGDTQKELSSFGDLQRTFIELVTRWVSYEVERTQTRAALRRERDRLEEFAAVISHDLRNPLNVASGRVELLKKECSSEHIEPASRALSRMEALIEDILALAHNDTQTATMTTVELRTAVQSAWETTETKAATLTVDFDEYRLRADDSRLRQLLGNLFRNAVEHGSESVDVRVCLLPDAAGFAVEDNGEGIPVEDHETIFEPGYTTDQSGTGFGLRIVDEVATTHDWDIHVTESRDGGARFAFIGAERV